MKGQASMELLITIAVVLAFSMPVILLFLSLSEFGLEKASLAQADSAARKLSDNINDVYSQGK